MKKILVLALPGIGNTLLLTPMLESLRSNYKDAKIKVLVMYKSCKEILEGNPNIDEIILFEFLKHGYLKSLKFMNKLSKEKFDISILPHPSNKLHYNLVSYFARAKIRLAHKYPYFKIKSLNFLQNKRLNLSNKHEIEENLELLKLLGINANDTKKNIFINLTDKNRDFASKFLKSNKISELKVGIHAGSSNLAGMENKRWPKERFVELCNYLIDNYKATILIFGGNDEIDLKEFIHKNLKNKNKAFIVNTNSIKDTAALIQKCDFFITNDSGLMHIAAAFNVKTIAVSGAADCRRTYPLNNNSGIIFHDISCYPCYKFGEKLHCKRKEKDYACLRYISIYNIIALMEKISKNEGMGPILERV